MKSSAKQRRKLHLILFYMWLIPGTAVWIILRDELWFVGFMSLYAIWVSHLTLWATETPVEVE